MESELIIAPYLFVRYQLMREEQYARPAVRGGGEVVFCVGLDELGQGGL